MTEADFGEQELLALSVECASDVGRVRLRALERATGLASGYADSGCLVVAADRDDAEELRRLHAFQGTPRPGVRVAYAAARRASWSRGCRRGSPGRSAPPRMDRSTRARWWRH
ncbi:MAG: hypothetical protein WKF40_08535 [Thermoleophilaceae bacterium]